jgi:hypothetical protein
MDIAISVGFNKWCEATKQLRVSPSPSIRIRDFKNTIIINSSWGLGENIVKEP